MKRSEMLNKLSKSIIENMSSSDNMIIVADEVLKNLEEAGMLPPFLKYFEQQDILDRWGLDTGKKEFVRVIKSKWEPEDEKK